MKKIFIIMSFTLCIVTFLSALGGLGVESYEDAWCLEPVGKYYTGDGGHKYLHCVGGTLDCWVSCDMSLEED